MTHTGDIGLFHNLHGLPFHSHLITTACMYHSPWPIEPHTQCIYYYCIHNYLATIRVTRMYNHWCNVCDVVSSVRRGVNIKRRFRMPLVSECDSRESRATCITIVVDMLIVQDIKFRKTGRGYSGVHHKEGKEFVEVGWVYARLSTRKRQ